MINTSHCFLYIQSIIFILLIKFCVYCRSQQTWAAAAQAGHFADEIAPITLKSKKGEVTMSLDEHPKPKTTIEQLGKLPTVFKKGGVVTAGSASGICDGAGAVIIASEDAVTKHGLTPLARIVGYGVSGKVEHRRSRGFHNG